MSKRTPERPTMLPFMMMELAWASWETIARRSLMMAEGSCSRAEYSRMLLEKMTATRLSAAMMVKPVLIPDWTAVLAPWHRRATSNARRLRRR